jgi:hypothetical protein
VADVVYDKRDQLEKIQAGLLDGEVVYAVYDGKGAGTGFIGLTDRRVVVQDNSLFGKRSAVTSIPYGRINAVSFVSDGSMLGKFASLSTVAIQVGSQVYEIEFRGVDKAKHAHDLVLWRLTS